MVVRNYKSLDFPLLKEQFRGDEEILVDMIKRFLEAPETLLNTMRKAVLERDAEQLKVSAHTFKGIMGNFFSPSGVHSAYELELCGIHGNFEEASVLLNKFENTLMLFLYELKILENELDKLS